MADNVNITEGDGGKVVATDDVSGVQYQVVKLDVGSNGASSPVTDLATSAKQDTGNTSLSSIDGKITAVNTGAVVISSSALPTGAATAAKQPALGTAGTASADVITVQGKSGMTALTVDGSGVTQPVSGTFWQATQPVSLASVPSHAVTNAGTFAVQVDGSALTSLQLIDDTVATHDSAATSKANQIAGEYSSSPAKVDDGDAVRQRLTQDGRILGQTETVAALTTNVNNNYSSAQTNTSIVSAPGANKRLVVVDIQYSRDTAGTMKLVEDPAGTPATKWGPHYFAANGGISAQKCYIPLTANKALGITSTGGGNETVSLRVITENV